MELFMWVTLVGVVIVAIWVIIQLSNGTSATAGDQPPEEATAAPCQEHLFAPETETPQSSPEDFSSFDPGPLIRDGMNDDWDIDYADREGVVTSRRITVKALYGQKYPKFAKAWCHLRKEERHFNLYNIEAATETSTGNAVPVTYHLMDFLDSASKRWHDVPDLAALDIVDQENINWSFQPSQTRYYYDRFGLRGKATKIDPVTGRKWSGQKSFYPDMCAKVQIAGSSQEIIDIEGYFKSAFESRQ